MGLTIIGPDQLQMAAVVSAPLVEIKRSWTDPWSFLPELQCLRASSKTASQGVGECELLYRYGPKVKHPHETDFAVRKAVNYRNYWVRITLSGGQGPVVVWTGRIAGEGREIHGTAAGPSGRHTWVAYEPLRLLERSPVAGSVWLADGANPDTDVKRLDWVPDMNGRGAWGMLVGNRSESDSVPPFPGGTGTYVYGGNGRWTRAEYARYVLHHFMAESVPNGPDWVLGGQWGLLQDIADIVKLDEGMSVADVLRTLINPRIGLDFLIAPMPGGFEVRVYPIGATRASFAGQSMPVNSRTVAIRPAAAKEIMRVNLSRTEDQRYGRIRVRGKRIVCVCTLRGAKNGDGTPVEFPSLVPSWSAADESAYIAAGGADASGAEADQAREDERFVSVYQDFAAPPDWDHQQGATSPVADARGELEAASDAQYQNQVRRTLSFLPFREGYSYETGGEVKRPGVGNLTGFMAPQAWIFDEDQDPKRYVAADKNGVTVSALSHEWGLRLQTKPNHLLGESHFPASDTVSTDVEPRYNYEKTVATIAFETDQRIELVFDGSPKGHTWAPSDGELVIRDDSAECWFAAPGTVFAMDAAGNLLTTPNDLKTGEMTLRNDIRQLYLWMAGAIVRYIDPRAKAEIFIKGWQPWSLLLGAILSVVDEGGESHQIQSPITQVDYLLENEAVTVIRAGFAR